VKLVYMGTPEFAVPTLEALVEAGHEVAAVYTQPDRPKGRGQALAMPPVKECALRLGLPVHQPEKIRQAGVFEELKACGAGAMVVVGYGQIIPQTIIDLPRYGILNVHASLLPAYRGAAPIQWALANGESVTGVTTMRIDAGLDTGDILLKAETPIDPEETAVELGARLATLGARLCVDTLAGLERGTVTPVKQDHARATIARILEKRDGVIDWTQPARVIHQRLRGFQPWPGGTTIFRGQALTIAKATPAGETKAEPGVLYSHHRRLFAACGAGTALELIEVQPAGKKRISAADFLNGARLQEGERLTS